ncbi:MULTISPECIES: very short patch repair endonuclease [unclassified Halomonas]|uniref:very short patch repair endonuclease n=1 Tax=unclassified Halomonas TaxID=2609666 RepID=UPI0021E5054B|nr:MULTISPECIES: DNA mismatch endonuclease Vsr [unclassified Halomonas]UYG00998.1 DNA mismatch endonuclease Vsr [Halomonas sp. GD1P12]WNL37940.1 DNA mismatch endonuclease Vsr [Halomonas sp. PAMB 3232]WNL41261.1 DNA mismatch endonuclease Vsr [Halomonas sp. PAMB 3264]
MTDIVDRSTRSKMMASIKGKNTAPERFVQAELERRHMSFEAHSVELPGKPDVILPLYQVALFVNGCFWHRHQGCFYATTPASQKTFWQEKLGENVERDVRKRAELEALGWRVIVVWECGVKHCPDQFEEVVEAIEGELTLTEWPEKPPRVRE